MATGYTSKVLEGQSFADFALNTSRTFCNLAERMEDPGRDPFTKSQSVQFYEDGLAKARDRLDSVLKMSFRTAATHARKEAERDMADIGARIAEKFAKLKCLTRMMNEVVAYVPPATERHQKHKQYMIDQLQETMDRDCDPQRDLAALKAYKVLTGAQWKKKEIEDASRDIELYEKGLRNESDKYFDDVDFIWSIREKVGYADPQRASAPESARPVMALLEAPGRK